MSDDTAKFTAAPATAQTGAAPSATITIPPNLASLLQTAINTAIQSPQLQGYQWVMTSGCQPSVLNNMYFCDCAEATGSVTLVPHGDSTGAHVDTNDHVDTNNHVDTHLVHDDAFADTVFGGSHTDSVPHDDTHTAHDDTSLPHDDTSAHGDTVAVSLSYVVRLTQLQGAGSLAVGDLVIQPVTLPLTIPPQGFAIPFTAAISFGGPLTASGYMDVSGVSGTASLPVSSVTGTMAGAVTLYCTGNTAGKTPGFYASITAMTVTLPTTVTSYGGWGAFISLLASFGIPTSWAEGAFNAVLAALTGLVNGMIASEVEGALNGLLDGELLAPCPC